MRFDVTIRWATGLLLLACCGMAGAQGFGGGGTTTGAARGTAGGTSRTGTSLYGGGPNVGAADVTYDLETRSLMVLTDEDTYKQIQEMMKGLDRPVPQVFIKAAFVEVSHAKDLDVGVEAGASAQLNTSQSNPTIGTASNLFLLGGAGTTGAGIYQILGGDFQATLRAIATAGKSELLSRPSILARNNETATISLGQDIPLVSDTRFDNNGNQINTVTYRNVGISLEVTPFIQSGGMVEMNVAPEASVLADRSQWVATSSGPSGTIYSPVINSRTASTTVIVPDGQTVVIGGLMQTQGNEADNKIPILGDIPLLGNLFKRHQSDRTKRELLIFLTPYIVQHPSMLAAVAQGEKDATRLVPQSFSDEELDRYLKTLPVKNPDQR